MSVAHQRRLKLIELSLGSPPSSFECQVKSFTFDPGEKDGDRVFTLCPDSQFFEDTDPEPTLALTFFEDWRSAGISRWLQAHNGQDVPFTLDHLPDIPAEHITISGTLRVKLPPVGAEARATLTGQITLQVLAGYTITPETP